MRDLLYLLGELIVHLLYFFNFLPQPLADRILLHKSIVIEEQLFFILF